MVYGFVSLNCLRSESSNLIAENKEFGSYV